MKMNIFGGASLAAILALTNLVQAEEPAAPPAPEVQTVAAADPAVKPPESVPAAPVGDAAPVAAPKVEAAPATPSTPIPGSADPSSVVIEYSEAEIQNVLRTLAAKAGVNMILGDEVVGKVTVHLENISYEEAMQLICESKGYAYVKDKNIVKIKSRDALAAEPVELKIIVLNYAKADDVKKTIDGVVSKQGKVQVDARSNTLIISDTPSSLKNIEPLVASLDSQTTQVLIEAKFVETTRNPQKDLGINWNGTLLNHEVSAGGSALSDTPGDPPKIITDAVNKPLSGFQWAKPAGGAALSPWVSGVALLDAGRASILFSYLSQDTDTELLASPRVVTTDNGKAKISIATQYPIPSFTFSEAQAAFQISGFDYKDIGIVLNVTPRINKNEFVTLEVMPEASSQTGVAKLASGGSSVDIPIIDTRLTSTTVLIKSGHTLAIGGLMRQDASDKYTKVPIMGDLPGIGAFFRSKSLSKTKRDLLVFLTPTIVSAEDPQTGFEQFKNGMPKEELYTNDKWMPKDNAKPNVKPLFKPASPEDKPVEAEATPVKQNFTPQP